MEPKMGVKELSEALEGMLELGLAFAELAKDGLQLSDLAALYAKMQAEPLRGKLAAAADKMSKVPAEAKDLDLQEGMQLAMLMLPYVPRYVEAFKK